MKITQSAVISIVLVSACNPVEGTPVTQKDDTEVSSSVKERVAEKVSIGGMAISQEAKDDLLRRCEEAFPEENAKKEFSYCASRIPFDGNWGD